MGWLIKITAILIFTLSCSKVDEKKPSDSSGLKSVEQKLEDLHKEALELRLDNGWLDDGCDAMLFQGKYQATEGAFYLDPRSAELSGEAGRFFRRGSTPCWDEKDLGSKTTWSRDMGLGLIYWLFRTKNLSALEDHATYGTQNKWQMGKPYDDGRVVYTPNMLSLLYNAIAVLGGDNSLHRAWPPAYPTGLIDYQAHLQVLSIALRGELARKLEDAPQKPRKGLLLSISTTMYDRLEEHAQRDPNPLYLAVLGKYSGNMKPAVDACLEEVVPEWDRCSKRECRIPDLAFACDFIMRVLKG